MAYDEQFALIDSDGNERFAALIKGTFQIGKDRRRTPTDVETFTRAILIEGEDGRFVCSDGSKPAVLKYRSDRSFKAVGYRLDPSLAARLGLPSTGRR